jgi:hypothetical protein
MEVLAMENTSGTSLHFTSHQGTSKHEFCILYIEEQHGSPNFRKDQVRHPCTLAVRATKARQLHQKGCTRVKDARMRS